MKTYICLDKNNIVVGTITKMPNSVDWIDFPGGEKTVKASAEDVAIYILGDFDKYELVNNKVVGKKGYEKKPRKSLQEEIEELRAEIEKLKAVK